MLFEHAGGENGPTLFIQVKSLDSRMNIPASRQDCSNSISADEHTGPAEVESTPEYAKRGLKAACLPPVRERL